MATSLEVKAVVVVIAASAALPVDESGEACSWVGPAGGMPEVSVTLEDDDVVGDTLSTTWPMGSNGLYQLCRGGAVMAAPPTFRAVICGTTGKA